MMKRIFYLPLIVIGFGLSLTGCDFTLEPEPVGEVVIDNVYRDVPGAITGINATYAPLAQAYNFQFWRLTDLASDDAWTFRGGVEPKLFTTDESSAPVQDIWETHFEGVARANVALARVPNVAFPSDQAGLREVLLGQAHFLRAFYYFNLVRLYGDVPLFTSEITDPQQAAIARTATEDVYAQIEQDLQDAANMLPAKSELDGSRGLQRGQATAGAANAILAKVYLTQEKWMQAAQAAQRVIDSGEYDLFDDYGDNFQGRNENGLESIFEIQYSGQGAGPGAQHNTRFGPPELVQGNGQMWLAATNDALDYGFPGDQGVGLVQAYEENDLRRDIAMSNYGLESFLGLDQPRFLVPNKYFVGEGSPPFNSTVNYPVMRYAEVLLIRAEALNEMGQSEDAAALIDQVRERAGLDPLSDSVVADQDALREAIWKERRVELSFESKRFFDLNRTGRLQERLAAQDIQIDPAKVVDHPITGKPKYLYAIPISELSNNANVEQNPGYGGVN